MQYGLNAFRGVAYALALFLVASLVSPDSRAQAVYLQPGEVGLYVGGAYSWNHSIPADVKGAGVGIGLGRVELGAAYLTVPEGGWESKSGALSVSVGAALLQAPKDPLTLVAGFMHQSIEHELPPYRRRPATTVTNTFSLTAAFPMDAGGDATLVPQVMPFFMRGSTPSHNTEVPIARVGLAFTLGIQQQLRGPFAFVIEPSVAFVEDSGMTYGFSVGLLLAGGGRQR